MPILNWIQIGIGAASAFALSFFLHSLDVTFIKYKHKQALIEQAKALDERCSRNQLITKEANHVFSSSLVSIDNRLGSDLLQPPACIVLPSTDPANAPTGGGKPTRPNGLNSRWLRKFAAECETYRQERVILEKFIEETWKENGQ